MKPWIEDETRLGAGWQVHGRTILPLGRVLRLQLPGLPGGIIWNRPAAVVVIDGQGSEQVLPVPDRTRRAIVLLYISALAVAAGFWLTRRLSRKVL